MAFQVLLPGADTWDPASSLQFVSESTKDQSCNCTSSVQSDPPGTKQYYKLTPVPCSREVCTRPLHSLHLEYATAQNCTSYTTNSLQYIGIKIVRVFSKSQTYLATSSSTRKCCLVADQEQILHLLRSGITQALKSALQQGCHCHTLPITHTTQP